jgi:glc operon protein GlcG
VAVVAQSTIDQATAQEIGARCAQAACELGVAVCIAVTDRSGHLLSFTRMDGAAVMSIGLAQDKAWSVTAFNGLPTGAWWSLIKDTPALVHGIVKTDRLIVFGGGAPVLLDGELVGAVGVSGGAEEQDVAIALAGAAVVG